MTLVQTLFGFKGRIRRRDWWLWSIAAAVAYFAFISVAGLILYGDAWSLDGFYDGQPLGDWWTELAFSILTQLPFLWVQLALAVKRGHDRNRGALSIVLLVLLTGAASYLPPDSYMAAGAAFDEGMGLGLLLLGVGFFNLVASLYLLVVLGFLDGTPGPNRFGASPKGIGGDLPAETARVFE